MTAKSHPSPAVRPARGLVCENALTCTIQRNVRHQACCRKWPPLFLLDVLQRCQLPQGNLALSPVLYNSKTAVGANFFLMTLHFFFKLSKASAESMKLPFITESCVPVKPLVMLVYLKQIRKCRNKLLRFPARFQLCRFYPLSCQSCTLSTSTHSLDV